MKQAFAWLLTLALAFSMMPAAFADAAPLEAPLEEAPLEKPAPAAGTAQTMEIEAPVLAPASVTIGATYLQEGDNTIGAVTANLDSAGQILTLSGSGALDEIYMNEGGTFTLRIAGDITVGSQAAPLDKTAVWSQETLKIELEAGASLTVYAAAEQNAVYVPGNLTVSGGALSLHSGYAALCAGENVTVAGGCQAQLTSQDSAIWAQNGAVAIQGAGTKVTIEAKYCVVNGKKGITVEGARVVGHTTEDIAFFTAEGNIAVTDADVVLTADAREGLMSDSGTGTITLTNSAVSLNTNNTAIFCKDDLVIDNTQLTMETSSNSLWTQGDLLIRGSETKFQSRSAFPVAADGTITIEGGAVDVATTGGTAFAADQGVFISGGTVKAHTEAKMAAIYAASGNIEITGSGTEVVATSRQDSAIFARDGQIHLMARSIQATGGNGEAAIVARQYTPADGSLQTEGIILGPDYLAGNNVIATTVWRLNSDGSAYYADTVFVPQGTQLPIRDTSAAVSQLVVQAPPPPVQDTAIALDKTELSLEPGQTAKLKATLTPADATYKYIFWESSDETVATVSDSGLVTAVADGTATITAKSWYGNTAACAVTVKTPDEPTPPQPVDPWPTEGLEGFVTRCYRVALSRDPDKAGHADWVRWLQNGTVDAATCTYGFVFSKEMNNKNLSDEAFVKTLYNLFMDREGEPTGVAFWTSYLNGGHSREEVLQGFADSTEFARIKTSYGLG